ncbi:MAG TPA: ATP synthase F1 subunit epsilon [Opitutaceae bacterium]
MALTLEIVTPEGRVFSDLVDTVVLPTSTGEIGILPGHVPLLTELAAGELRVTRGDAVESIACGSGFAEVDGDKVSVLAEQAINVAAIDENAVEKAIARAQEALRNRDKLPTDELERLEGVMRFAYAQLDLKRRRR